MGCGGIIYRSPRVNGLRVKIAELLTPRVQIGASRSILSNISLPLCNTCKPLVCAIRVPSFATLEARCNGNVAGRRGKERDVSLWDNPPLLGADYGLPAPNMAALLFNVRLMGSFLSRSLVATYHALYGLVVVAVGFTVERDRAGSSCFVVLVSFFVFLYSSRQVLFCDMYVLMTSPMIHFRMCTYGLTCQSGC